MRAVPTLAWLPPLPATPTERPLWRPRDQSSPSLSPHCPFHWPGASWGGTPRALPLARPLPLPCLCAAQPLLSASPGEGPQVWPRKSAGGCRFSSCCGHSPRGGLPSPPLRLAQARHSVEPTLWGVQCLPCYPPMCWREGAPRSPQKPVCGVGEGWAQMERLGLPWCREPLGDQWQGLGWGCRPAWQTPVKCCRAQRVPSGSPSV